MGETFIGYLLLSGHWDKSLWRDDLRRMKENGIFTVRIAEFAWNKIEPAEGEFTYEFFDEFLDVAEEEQMKVIFGTPTADTTGLADREISGSAELPPGWYTILSWNASSL